MGVYQEKIKEETKNFLIVVKTKNWADLGYWIRDIKRKLNKTKIIKIKITLSIDYYDEDIY